MRFLFPLLILFLLTGCAAPVTESTPPGTAVPEVTVPAAAVPPETTQPPDPLTLLLSSMTVEEKAGQLFIAAPEQLVPGIGPITAMSGELADALARYPVGGIILFRDNILSPEQLREFTQGLGDSCPVAPFLCVDEEGGIVARLANHPAFDLPRYSSAAAVGASETPRDALEMGRAIGAYLKEYGFHVDFAPVADVNTNPGNPVIGTRAFSSDPETAAAMAAAFARGLRENGIIATFKHFPGHGDTNQDSHSGLAVSNRTPEELRQTEFLPFLAAESGDMVMVGHIALPNVTGDMTPATLSYRVVTEILKEELGFSGLVITDAMNMGAIVQCCSSGEAAVAALTAGCDILLMPENLPEAFDAVISALKDGTMTPEEAAEG